MNIIEILLHLTSRINATEKYEEKVNISKYMNPLYRIMNYSFSLVYNLLE